MESPEFKEIKPEYVDWSRIDLVLNTYSKFVNDKPESKKLNSMIDLPNFLYLTEKAYIYWSEEKKFLELTPLAYFNNIPTFIYPDDKIVRKIF